MFRSRHNGFVWLLLGFPAVLGAQRGAAPPFEGPRGFYTFDLADGEPVSFFLEVSHELGLSEPQKGRLMDIRRRLRVVNAPHMLQLDSLRELAGIDLGDRNGINEKDVESLRRFSAWSKPVVDSIRLNNDLARAEARAVLNGDQRTRLDSIARADATRTRRPRRGRAPNRQMPLPPRAAWTWRDDGLPSTPRPRW